MQADRLQAWLLGDWRLSLAVRLAVCVAIVAVSGCGKYSPVVDSKKDVERLASSEPIVRARTLPDAEIASLTRLRQLEQLDFSSGYASYKAKITDKGLGELAQLKMPRLKSLNLGYCSNISDRGLLAVSTMQTLTDLMLWYCPEITDAGLEHVSKMSRLKWLSLMGCARVTDAGMPSLLGMTNLTALDLRGCPAITDRGLEYLAAKTNWHTIMLGGCSNVTAEAVLRLQRALPNADVKKDEREWSWHERE